METVMVAANTISRFIVIQSSSGDKGNAHYDKDGFVVLGEDDEGLFSTLVKIEAERATIDDKFVNLRFCNSNKYWQKNAGDEFIVAVSNKAEEDTTKPSCTLFEAVKVESSLIVTMFYLVHVASGARLSVDSATKRFTVQSNPEYNLSYVNWDTLVKLPEKVTFKGFNGSYLQGVWAEGHPFLQFAEPDPNKETTGYRITRLPNGIVRIYSNHFTKYWRHADDWIWADSTDTTANDINTLFTPIKVDDNTIALRSLGNNNYFCKSHSWDGFTNCLNAAVPTIENEARIGVQELVSGRRLYNVRYRMEDSRIFDETPFLAGTTTAYNYSDSEAAIGVEVAYEDEKSYSFTRSLSLSAGVTSTIEFGVPLIEKGTIKVSYEISTTMEWNTTTTTRISVTATGSAPVPPRSMATITYVGTMGTCDVPFSYTQQDTSSSDGSIIEHEQIDGVYRGVNAYNFSFVVEKTQPLA